MQDVARLGQEEVVTKSLMDSPIRRPRLDDSSALLPTFWRCFSLQHMRSSPGLWQEYERM